MLLAALNFGRSQRALRANGIVLFLFLLKARPFLGAYRDTQGWGSLPLESVPADGSVVVLLRRLMNSRCLSGQAYIFLLELLHLVEHLSWL